MGLHVSFLRFLLNEDIFYPGVPGIHDAWSYQSAFLVSYAYTRRPIDCQGEAYINRLPHEVLSIIFIYCLPNDVYCLPHTAHAPLLLCRVSSLWQKVAIHTPQLWSSLMLVLPPKTTLEAVTIGVSKWFQRSGALPLTIRMVAYPTHAPTSDFFDAFIPYFPRWRNLKLHIPGTLLTQLIAHPAALSYLTTFVLSCNASLAHCIAILARCPNLEHCSFQRVFEASTPTFPSRAIVLSHLRCLKIYGGQDLCIILDCIETPQLRDLDVTFYWPQPWHKGRMVAIFQRSGFSLQRFAIEGLDIPEDDLVDCARRLPQLLRLDASLRGVSLVPQKALDILSQRRENPHMRRLSLQVTRRTGFRV